MRLGGWVCVRSNGMGMRRRSEWERRGGWVGAEGVAAAEGATATLTGIAHAHTQHTNDTMGVLMPTVAVSEQRSGCDALGSAWHGAARRCGWVD